jgi:hypothetical protein
VLSERRRRIRTVSRADLPRIFEIRDCVARRGGSETYFQDFENSLANNPVKRKHFLHIETELGGLDLDAWTYLKTQVVPLFGKKNPPRGWQAAFDKLNQAKAFNYLVRCGCTQVAFVRESTVPGRKTPDLHGRLNTKNVLCEVKTINPSDDESAARVQMTARFIQGELPNAFFGKLTSTLKAAEKQMGSYCPNSDSQLIVYVVLNFDDSLNEYVDKYLEQIRSFCVSSPLPKVEIVFDTKPAYYSATSDSIASQLFVHSAERPWRSMSNH